MKKLTISSAFLILMVSVISCKKETENFARATTSPAGSTTTQSNAQTIVSKWFPLFFNTVSDRGVIYLQGKEPFYTHVVYDKSIHVELAYVSLPGQRIPVIHRLPMKFNVPEFDSQNSPGKVYGFDFLLDNSGFIVSVKNLNDATVAPEPEIIQDFTYRYIVIPITVYQSLNIDWNNYREVANALNL